MLNVYAFTQVWNHPWVLKLDEQRQNERAERLAMYGESDDSLGGFIVSGSEEEEAYNCRYVNKIGDKTPSCHTPFDTGKGEERIPFHLICSC